MSSCKSAKKANSHNVRYNMYNMQTGTSLLKAVGTT